MVAPAEAVQPALGDVEEVSGASGGPEVSTTARRRSLLDHLPREERLPRPEGELRAAPAAIVAATADCPTGSSTTSPWSPGPNEPGRVLPGRDGFPDASVRSFGVTWDGAQTQ